MHTQWLFFDTEAAGLAYNDACNAWMAGHKQARAWNGGFNVANGDNWGEAWQTSDDALFWPAGNAAGMLGKWASPMLGLPVWGWEMDWRQVQAGDPTDEENSAPQMFPLDNRMDVEGEPTEIYDRAYWMGTIPEGAIYVEDGFVPQWPEDS